LALYGYDLGTRGHMESGARDGKSEVRYWNMALPVADRSTYHTVEYLNALASAGMDGRSGGDRVQGGGFRHVYLPEFRSADYRPGA